MDDEVPLVVGWADDPCDVALCREDQAGNRRRGAVGAKLRASHRALHAKSPVREFQTMIGPTGSPVVEM
jgi:hypothetical protein